MHAQPGVGLRPDTPASSEHAPHESRSSAWGYLPPTAFRSRRSTLSNAQRETWERLWPRLGREADAAAPLDTPAWFGRQAPLVLEIGCGSGTSTLAMAKDEPHLDVLAVEIYRRGLAQLLCGIDQEQVNNIRLIRGNGVDVLQHLIGPQQLTGVRIFFPDPWPKARHHKRRLLQPATVSLIADRLLPGGVLHAATDHSGYAEHIEAVGAEIEKAELLSRAGEDTLPISVVRPTTKYETKAQEAGSAVTEFVWKRRD